MCSLILNQNVRNLFIVNFLKAKTVEINVV